MTNRLELNWKLDGFVDEQRYYRSETPIDINSLPPPTMIFAGEARTYIDNDIEAGQTYYVRIGSVRNGVEKMSDEVAVDAFKPHRFRWLLIYITENNGAAYTSMQEVAIASTIGGEDVTTPEMGTSQSSYYAADNAKASKLVDKNFIDAQFGSWISATDVLPPHWVALDFAEVTDFAELKIWPQNYAGGTARAPKDFVVQGSNNGSDWSTIASFTGVTDWIAGTPKIFNLVSSEIT